MLKCTLQSLPLELKLGSKLLHDFLSRRFFGSNFTQIFKVIHLGFVFLKSGVFDRIVPEVESFALVDSPAHPLAKIIVTECALFPNVQVFQDFHEVIVVEEIVVCISKETHDIFRGDLTVFVDIEVEEGLTNRDPSVLEFLAQEFC